MLNLFYRGYVIREDIRSICYTIYGTKPHRAELRSRSTALEAMKWVDRDLARMATVPRVHRSAAHPSNKNSSSLAQPALL